MWRCLISFIVIWKKGERKRERGKNTRDCRGLKFNKLSFSFNDYDWKHIWKNINNHSKREFIERKKRAKRERGRKRMKWYAKLEFTFRMWKNEWTSMNREKREWEREERERKRIKKFEIWEKCRRMISEKKDEANDKKCHFCLWKHKKVLIIFQ